MKKYSEIRNSICSGDLVAWSHRGIKSLYDLKIWFVTLFTQSRYTHVGVAWCIGDRVFVIEAVMPLVRIYPLSKTGDFYHINQNFEWTEEVESLALSIVGEEYSQLQAIEAPIRTPSRDSKWQCAEFYAVIAKELGADLGNIYTPQAIVEASLQRHNTQLTKVTQDIE